MVESMYGHDTLACDSAPAARVGNWCWPHKGLTARPSDRHHQHKNDVNKNRHTKRLAEPTIYPAVWMPQLPAHVMAEAIKEGRCCAAGERQMGRERGWYEDSGSTLWASPKKTPSHKKRQMQASPQGGWAAHGLRTSSPFRIGRHG
jgi:hypothetical protein